MLDRLKQLVSPGARLPEPAEALLRAQFVRLDAIPGGPDLAARALRFIRTSDGDGVLAELAARPGLATLLQLKAIFHHRLRERRELFRALPSDPALHLRLALVYEAATRQEGLGPLLDPALRLPAWLAVWLWEASSFCPNSISSDDGSWTRHELLEEMLALAGEPRDTAVRAALRAVNPRWALPTLGRIAASVPGLREALERHPGAVAEALAIDDARELVRVLEALGRERAVLGPHLARLAELSAWPAKTVRAAAQALLRGQAEAAAPFLEALCGVGAPEQRTRAAQALWSLRGDGARPFLAARVEAEGVAHVKRSLTALLAGPPREAGASPAEVAALAAQEPAVAPELLPPLDLDPGPLPDGARAALRTLADRWHRQAEEQWQRIEAQHPGRAGSRPAPVSDERLDAALRYMERPGAGPPDHLRWDGGHAAVADEDLAAFLACPGLGLVHAVRMLAVAGLAEAWRDELRFGFRLDPLLRGHRHAQRLDYGLREVAGALALCDVPAAALGRGMLFGWGRRTFRWEPEAVWPYFLEHPAMLEEALGLVPGAEPRHAASATQAIALELLSTFPRVPERLAARLWELALGTAKTDRAAAQRCLAGDPGAKARILAALGDGRWEARAVAAQWLGELGGPDAAAALEAALRKERHDGAKAALMGALEAMGVEVERFLDRPGLSKEAAKAAAKGVPGPLARFELEALPRPRWTDTGEELAAEVIRHWAVQCQRLGDPAPGAVLRRYARMLEPAGREALGLAVLRAWIAADLRVPTPEELEEAFQREMKGYWPQFATPEQIRSTLASRPVGSAVAAKGLLALAAACAGAGAAPLVQQYLKTWYGMRAAQCKALLQMLSWVDHPSAIQVVLATATRFRTAGIRKEAEVCAQAIAERRGWTVADLADRTIPTGGFDDEGALELDCGGRVYRARLGDDLAIELLSPEGKPVSGLPEPKTETADDPTALARAALSAARKEVKATAKLQAERLREAMCSGRAWSADDWETYLHRHPLVGRLCRRLVWEARRGEERVGSFRPLGDGSLTGPADQRFELPAGATVRLAHAVTAPEAERAAWSEHLATYEVVPLFDQLGRAPRLLAPADGVRRSVEEFQGHMVKTLKLRARASKLGYVRGPAEDGGWFYEYRKNLPTLGLEAAIRFTGNSLPEEERPAALLELTFRRGEREAQDEVTLGEVPPVLLSECWNDLAALAADGTGFDPEWERKVQP